MKFEKNVAAYCLTFINKDSGKSFTFAFPNEEKYLILGTFITMLEQRIKELDGNIIIHWQRFID